MERFDGGLGQSHLDAIIDAGLLLGLPDKRELLFARISPARRYEIPQGATPKDQLVLDVRTLDGMSTTLGPDFLPIRIWLQNAIELAGVRAERVPLEAALRELDTRWPQDAPPRVLLIEDDPVLAGRLAAVLKARAINVRTAGDIHTAFELIDTFAASLGVIALDLSLPDRRGNTEVLKGGPPIAGYVHERYRHIRVLGMSQFTDKREVERLVPTLDTFLEKGTFTQQPRVFVEAVERLLSAP